MSQRSGGQIRYYGIQNRLIIKVVAMCSPTKNNWSGLPADVFHIWNEYIISFRCIPSPVWGPNVCLDRRNVLIEPLHSHCVINSCTLHVSNHTSALGQMLYPSWHVAHSYLFPDFPGISEPLKNNHAFINFDKCIFLLSPPKTNYAKRTRTCNQIVKKLYFFP